MSAGDRIVRIRYSVEHTYAERSFPDRVAAASFVEERGGIRHPAGRRARGRPSRGSDRALRGVRRPDLRRRRRRQLRLRRGRALCFHAACDAEAASPGLWLPTWPVFTPGRTEEEDAITYGVQGPSDNADPIAVPYEEDAQFIAMARVDVPDLCAEVRRVRSVIDEVRQVLDSDLDLFEGIDALRSIVDREAP